MLKDTEVVTLQLSPLALAQFKKLLGECSICTYPNLIEAVARQAPSLLWDDSNIKQESTYAHIDAQGHRAGLHRG